MTLRISGLLPDAVLADLWPSAFRWIKARFYISGFSFRGGDGVALALSLRWRTRSRVDDHRGPSKAGQHLPPTRRPSKVRHVHGLTTVG